MRTKESAILSEEDSSTFFRLFIPLLAAVNQAYEISDDLNEQLLAGRPNYAELLEVAEALWEDSDEKECADHAYPGGRIWHETDNIIRI